MWTNLAFFVGWLIEALALQWLWRWFVADSFGIPLIGFVQAGGIVILVQMLTHQYHPIPNDKRLTFTLLQLAVPAAVLFLGWILHFFV